MRGGFRAENSIFSRSMDFFKIMDYVFWLPVFFWVLLYFWFYRCSFPLYLRKMVKKGKKWAVVPEKVSHRPSWVANFRAKNFLFALLASLALSATVCWAFEKTDVCPAVYGLAATPVFLVFALVLYRIAMRRVSALFEAAYFLEYRKVRYQSERKGNFQNEADIHNRTIWSFTKKLRNAEAHRRFWKYLNAMAKTKKIPPDVYAETMYV